MTPAEKTSVDNKTLVQTIMDARARGDHAPFAAAMADDFVWRIIGTTAWSGEYVGKDDVRERLLKPLYKQFAARPQITPTRILADGDHVVVQCIGDAPRMPASAMPTRTASSFAWPMGSRAR